MDILGLVIDSLVYVFNAPSRLSAFMESGGRVLWLIAAVTLLMWSLALERLWYYYRGALQTDIGRMRELWDARGERSSWYAEQIRRRLLADMSKRINFNLPLIATLVALCPMLGLLGTVTGMIEVFHVMAVTGGGDPKAMAGGVSRATVPTMAGMVAALSGLFINTWVTRTADRRRRLLENQIICE